MKSELQFIYKKYPNRQREDLIPILQSIQEAFGYLSEEIITHVGDYLDISVNKIYGVATFYDNFRFEPQGKYHVRLCHGTACHVAGATTILTELEKILKLKPSQTDKEGLFSLEVVSCIGACGLAPLIQINEDYYPAITREKLQDIFSQIREQNKSTYIS